MYVETQTKQAFDLDALLNNVLPADDFAQAQLDQSENERFFRWVEQSLDGAIQAGLEKHRGKIIELQVQATIPRTVRSFGFTDTIVQPVRDDDPFLRHAQDEIARLQGLLDARATLRNALLSKGLMAMAILPAHVWVDLCHIAGLIRFEHFSKQSGRVPANRPTWWQAQRYRFGLMRKSSLLKTLWPEGHDAIGRNGESWISVTPELPTPPKYFSGVLHNCIAVAETFPVCVAAHPEVIGINPIELVRPHQDHDHPVTHRLKEDPVLYTKTKEGDYVALLSEFGPFPNKGAARAYIENMLKKRK